MPLKLRERTDLPILCAALVAGLWILPPNPAEKDFLSFSRVDIETTARSQDSSIIAGNEPMVIEDFETSSIGCYPAGWGYRVGWGFDPLPEQVTDEIPYVIRENDGDKFLHVADTGQSITLARKAKWNLHTYPCLRWKWRVASVPEGADEKNGNNDSAAGVYVLFSRNFFGIPKIFKFTWSSSVENCDRFHRGPPWNPWYIVLETGLPETHEWVTETVNLFEAYKEVYGEDPPQEPIGIGILSDANASEGSSVADYDEFQVLRECQDGCN